MRLSASSPKRLSASSRWNFRVGSFVVRSDHDAAPEVRSPHAPRAARHRGGPRRRGAVGDAHLLHPLPLHGADTRAGRPDHRHVVLWPYAGARARHRLRRPRRTGREAGDRRPGRSGRQPSGARPHRRLYVARAIRAAAGGLRRHRGAARARGHLLRPW
jgi:hypothetical protein